MKATGLNLCSLAILMLFSSVSALPQQGEVTTSQVLPERGPLPPAVQLSEEEQERIMAATMVSVERLLQGPAREQPGPDDPAGPETPAGNEQETEVVDPIAALESVLGEASQVPGPQMSATLLRLLDLRDASLRVTAIHWLSARPDIADHVLAKALTDQNTLVKTVAEQILFERGLSDQELEEVKAEAVDGREAVVRRIIGPLLRRAFDLKTVTK